VSQPTYPLRALVLRRTKLGESDLILTLLAADGRREELRAASPPAPSPPAPSLSASLTFCAPGAAASTL